MQYNFTNLAFCGLGKIDEINDPAKQDTTVACGDPVNVVTGSFTWEYTDVALYGAEELAFTRRYDSRDSYIGAMGYRQ